MIAGAIAAVIEFSLETAAAAEVATTAAGLTEGGVVAASAAAEAAAGGAETFGVYDAAAGTTSWASEGALSYDTGAAVGRGTVNWAGMSGLVADPMGAVASRASAALMPETATAMEGWGQMIGENVGGAAQRYYTGSLAYEYGAGFGYEVGGAVGRAAPGIVPGKMTSVTAKRVFSAMRNHAKRTGEKLPFKDWKEVQDDYNSRGTMHHHTKKIHRAVHKQLNAKSNRMAPLLPNKKTQTLRWSSGNGRIALGAGDTSYETLKLNSIVNPGDDLATTDTHEPMGYTQMTAMYEQYYVKETRVIIDYFNAEDSAQGAGTAASGFCFGLCPKDDKTELTTIGHYQELPHSTWRVLGPEVAGRMTYSIKPNRFFGKPDKSGITDSKLNAVVTADPDDILYLHIFAQRMNIGNVDNINIELHITVEYDVVFHEPKSLAQS